MAKQQTSTDIPDSLYIREKIDEISRHHLRFKQDISDVKESLNDVKTTLKGTNTNGNKGLVDLIEKIDDRLYCQEKKMILVEDAMFEYKWTARVILTALIGFIFWFIKSKQ